MSTQTQERGLGAFTGVYRPTILTILGVMMYLREGWVVGQAGLAGAFLLILLIFLITGTTALSLSSIATNTRVGAGGVFAIISRSLGLESGGSIGIPLYLGQALSAALYIYGFSEVWLYFFPGHPQLLVVYAIFAIILTATLTSTRLAFRVQGLVMIIILASLVSIVLGLSSAFRAEPLEQPHLWGAFEETNFWVLFAIFFPAGTGIMVGASMSSALKDPRRSIPVGTLGAAGTALLVYLFMAVWYSLVATPEELRENFFVVSERAALPELVSAGVLASTFTAALSTLVAAPRVLQALGHHGVIPYHNFLAQVTEAGDPRNATIVTAGLVAAALLLGSLDRVAMLITMFFLLTYLSINIVVMIEQSLGMISFRPSFRIPIWVPALGVVGCLIAILVISPAFALVAISIIVAIYIWLSQRRLETPWETVRSSIFVSLADWASKRMGRSQGEANERSWKPDLLVPVTTRGQLDGAFRFLCLLTKPKGSLKILGIQPSEAAADNPDASRGSLDGLQQTVHDFEEQGLVSSATVIEAPSLVKGVHLSTVILRSSTFPPNILFGFAHLYDEETLQGLVDVAAEQRMGVALLYEHPEAALGHERRLNVWVREQSPTWQLGLRMANLDLTVLLAYQIHRNWRGPLRLLMACPDPEEEERAETFLERLIDDARLPDETETWVTAEPFERVVPHAPRADLNVFGLARQVDRDMLRRLVQQTGSSCLFVRDSGRESALA